MTQPADTPPLIEVTALSRQFGDHVAVDNISFRLLRGQILGFLGPNGAGKSTTMQMLTGNLAPSSGTVQIRGIDLHHQAKRAKTQLGYLPEQPPLYLEMSVDEYLLFCARLHGIAKVDINEALARSKDRCGLSEVGPRMIGNLSKGYQQRVGIAQAIIHNPEIIILDEPTVGLDPIQIIEIRQLIKQLGQNHGIILSTHILPEVQSICDRVQIINEGKLVFSGSLNELDATGGCHSISIKLLRAPAFAALEQLDGIVSAEHLQGNHFRLYLNDNQTDINPLLESLAQHAVQHDWGLIELLPEHTSLEQVFIDLTVKETRRVDH